MMPEQMKTHLDICSGIGLGGFSLAAGWAGYTTVGFVEIDSFCRRVLAKNFPGVPMHDDLKTLEGHRVRQWIAETEQGVRNEGTIVADAPTMQRTPQQWHQPDRDDDESRTAGLDLLTAGYPCQPFSLAGQRMGAEDDRHLWPFIAALVAELKPRRVLLENVYGHVSMGLDAVLSDLEALGYACGAVVVPACAVGAPHRRDRVWILAELDANAASAGAGDQSRALGGQARQQTDAYEPAPVPQGNGAECAGLPHAVRGLLADAGCGDDAGRESASRGHEPNGHDAGWSQGASGTDERGEDVPDATSGRQPGPGTRQHAGYPATDRQWETGDALDGDSTGEGTETLSGVGQPFDGLSGRLAQWAVGPERLDPWAGDWEAGMPRTVTHEQDRTHKLKALGNAIVPQVAYEILRFWGQP